MKKQRLSMPPVIVERSPKRKNGQKIKQLLSLLLTVCLIIGLVPQTAYATEEAVTETVEERNTGHEQYKEVLSEALLEGEAASMDEKEISYPMPLQGESVSSNEENTITGYCGAEEEGKNLRWIWDADTTTLIITGEGEMADYYYIDTSPFAAYENQVTTLLVEDGVTKLGSYAFSDFRNLENVTLADSIREIADYAFYACNKMTNITLPENLEIIGEYAFEVCQKVTSISLPGKVTTIGNNAFSRCTALGEVYLPASVTSLGSKVFFSTSAIVTVAEENPCYMADEGVLFDKKQEKLIFCPKSKTGTYQIPEGVKNIEDSAFYQCAALESVIIPNSVESIGEWAFYSCASLTSIVLPEGVRSIEGKAFMSCDKVESITIPRSVISIGEDAFYGCSKLQTVNVPCHWDGSLYTFKEGVEVKKAPHSVDSNGHCENCDFVCEHLHDLESTDCEPTADKKKHLVECGTCGVIAVEHSFHESSGCGACGVTGGYCGAEEEGKNLRWIWDADNTTLIITGEGEMADYGLSNRPFAAFESQVTTLLVEDGVTKLGSYAFYDLSNLENVTLADSIREISDDTFAYCGKMTNITLPENLEIIGENAFVRCSECTSIRLPGKVTTIGNNAFGSCTALREVYLPASVTSLGAKVFYSTSAIVTVAEGNLCYMADEGVLFDKKQEKLIFCPKSKTGTYQIPEGVKNIEESAFDFCAALESVIIPNSVESIGEWAFYSCDSLTSIVLPEGVRSIGGWAFMSCDKLESITIPGSVISIGKDAFRGSDLQTVNAPCHWDGSLYAFPTSVEVKKAPHSVDSNGHCENCDFVCEHLHDLEATDCEPTADKKKHLVECGTCGVIAVEHSFRESSGCGACGVTGGYCGAEEEGKNLRWIWDADNTTLMITGEGAMADYGSSNRPFAAFEKQVTTLLVEDGVTKLGSYAFSNFKNLENVTLADSIREIADYAFYFCNKMTSITLPENLETIGEYAFGVWQKVTSISLPGKVTTIGSKAFGSCTALREVYLPASVTSLGAGVFLSTSAIVTVAEENPCYMADEGVLFDKKQEKLIFCPKSKTGTYQIPEGVKSIEKEAFYDCNALESVIIPSSMESIGENAFAGCRSLISITIPEGVRSIGENAFFGCSKLESITIPRSVTSIGEGAFYPCNALQTVNAPCNWDGSLYTFEEGVEVKIAPHDFDENGQCKNCEHICDHVGHAKEGCNTCGMTDDRIHTVTYLANDNIITAECMGCGSTGSITITAADKVYDGTEIAVGVEQTGILEEVLLSPVYREKEGENLEGAPVNAGVYTLAVTLEGATATEDFEIRKAALSISGEPIATDIFYGQSLENSQIEKCTMLGNGSPMEGQWYWKDGTIRPEVSGTYGASFVPKDQKNYENYEVRFLFVSVEAGEPDIDILVNQEELFSGQEVKVSVEAKNAYDPTLTDVPEIASVTWQIGEEEAKPVENGRILLPKDLPAGTRLTITAVTNALEEKYQETTVSNTFDVTAVAEGIWVSEFDRMTYTGSARIPSFQVYDGEKLLQEKKDYTVTYKNNKNAYTWLEEDYKAFEENLQATGKRVKTGTFDPKKAPQMVLKMKGNYAGTKVVYFPIAPADLATGEFRAEDLAVTYTGKKQTPAPVVTWKGKKLKYGKDFSVPEYDAVKSDKTAYTAPGEEPYKLTIKGEKNFTGELPITLTISRDKQQIAMSKVKVGGVKNQPWSGEHISQNHLKVSYGKDILVEETVSSEGEYLVTHGENKAVGTGSITLTGTGKDTDGDGLSYVGRKTVTFKIMGTSLSKATVSGLEKSYFYTGVRIEPKAVVTIKAAGGQEARTLIEGVDYTCTYEKNIEKGTASIIFTGLESGGFTGIKKQTFQIVPVSFGEEEMAGGFSVSFHQAENLQEGVYVASYLKGGAQPGISVSFNNLPLEQGKDFTISYSNHKKPALSTDAHAPTLTIKGKGNFTGTKKITFTIMPKALTAENGIQVVIKDKIASTKAGGYRQNFQLLDEDGKVLGKADYDASKVTYTLIETSEDDGKLKEENIVLTGTSVVEAGSTIRVTIPGKGIYAGGEVSGTYRILEQGKDISKAVIQIENQEYTGKPVEILRQEQFKKGKVYLKIGEEIRELVLGKDIRVVPGSYEKNEAKGTAKVTFHGLGDLGGSKTVNYKITSQKVDNFWKGIRNWMEQWMK